MPREVEIVVSDPSVKVDESSVVDCVAALDQLVDFVVPPGSIEVAFVDEATCRKLHRDFFGDPDLTDVMTFPGDPGDGHAGDIAICPLVAARSCRTEGTSLEEELTLYMVHAWLHLAGLDDKESRSIGRMRAAESQAMDYLRRASRTLRVHPAN